MKKKRTLQKATMAAGVMAMSLGMFNAFDAESRQGGGCSTKGYKEVSHTCANGTETHRCRYTEDDSTCNVSGQDPC